MTTELTQSEGVLVDPSSDVTMPTVPIGSPAEAWFDALAPLFVTPTLIPSSTRVRLASYLHTISNGSPPPAAASAFGFSPKTIVSLRRDPIFAALESSARSHLVLQASNTVSTAIASQDVDTAKWALERADLSRDHFRKSVELPDSGGVTINLTFNRSEPNITISGEEEPA